MARVTRQGWCSLGADLTYEARATKTGFSKAKYKKYLVRATADINYAAHQAQCLLSSRMILKRPVRIPPQMRRSETP